MTYVAIIQQGMILDQRVVASGEDEEAIRQVAEAAAQKANEAQTGEAVGYTAVVLST